MTWRPDCWKWKGMLLIHLVVWMYISSMVNWVVCRLTGMYLVRVWTDSFADIPSQLRFGCIRFGSEDLHLG